MKRTLITGSGSYIPEVIKKNEDFLGTVFYDEHGTPLSTDSKTVVEKFRKITGINERRYAAPHQNTSDLAAEAAKLAMQKSQLDGEQLDLLIVAHNFGDIAYNSNQSDLVPAIASRVKHLLGIKNPRCIALDTIFGCPGWLMGVIQVDAFFKAGMAERALVIGAETLSRVIDPFDRDSMIFADGAGATVLEYIDDNESGILHSSVLSHCIEEIGYLKMENSYERTPDRSTRYMKMSGRKVYEYALKYVPEAMKDCLDRSGCRITELKKVFIHQANEKMDEAILQAFYKLYGLNAPPDVMPMCIHWLGNSSVATIPTLFDLVTNGLVDNHQLQRGDLVLFASVGAGMNINAVTYRCP